MIDTKVFPKYCQAYHGKFAEYYVKEPRTYLCQACFNLCMAHLDFDKPYTITRLFPQNRE